MPSRSGMADDPLVREIREAIVAADEAVLAAVNRRVGLVARLREHKQAHGYDLVDPEREAWLVDHLGRTNGGPLSDEGARQLALHLLELTRREIEQDERAPTR